MSRLKFDLLMGPKSLTEEEELTKDFCCILGGLMLMQVCEMTLNGPVRTRRDVTQSGEKIQAIKGF